MYFLYAVLGGNNTVKTMLGQKKKKPHCAFSVFLFEIFQVVFFSYKVKITVT